jgi:16S rRNA (guanine966-N2)-methyltransferase
MHINAGKYKRHNIYQCNLETTRETSDMVRQATFNLLGQFFKNITVLDLFSGSGSLGLEAISRGASFAIFNDLNKKALDVTKKNLDYLKVDPKEYKLYNLDYKDCIKALKENSIDLILLDPPYKMNDIASFLKLIYEANILKEKGIISFEMSKDTLNIESPYFNVLQNRTYGVKRVVIYGKR